MSQVVKTHITPIDPNVVPELEDNTSAPEIYVDGLGGLGTPSGVVKLVFFSEKQTIPTPTAGSGISPYKRKVAVTLVLTPAALNTLVVTLPAVLEQFRSAGMTFPNVSVEAAS
ncbi:hypothetical protein [Acidocella facilis]|uniref:hypothetical protein n=1 Tax=Acidocella facilis TaxID=525 RepID=UPI001F2DD20A|nr:hypothetical protein [Acidocella facilis]